MSKELEAVKRLKWGLDITHEERINLCECIEKELKRLAKIDELLEELGIELLTLFKALDGIYYRFSKKGEIHKMKVPMLRKIDGEYCWICPTWMTTTWMNVKVKDYGKTWALTKEELE